MKGTFTPLKRCPGLNCDALIDGSRGPICSACKGMAPQTKNQRRRAHRKQEAT